MTVTSQIETVFTGKIEARWEGKPPSAIGKRPVAGPVAVTARGLIGDAQADLSVHGGPDKALHHYAADHYPAWRSELARDDLAPGAFGENIAAYGLTEANVCIGDIFTLGSATVQVSQGRQPCWKLAAHAGEPRMAWLFQKTGRTGWYYRVLSPGTIEAGAPITLVDRPWPDWSVQRVTAARLTRRVTPAEAQALAELPELAEGWRAAFARLAGGERNEDTAKRLNPPESPQAGRR